MIQDLSSAVSSCFMLLDCLLKDPFKFLISPFPAREMTMQTAHPDCFKLLTIYSHHILTMNGGWPVGIVI